MQRQWFTSICVRLIRSGIINGRFCKVQFPNRHKVQLLVSSYYLNQERAHVSCTHSSIPVLTYRCEIHLSESLPFGAIIYCSHYVTSPQKGNRSFTPDFPRFEVRSKVYENISIYVIIALLVTHARDP